MVGHLVQILETRYSDGFPHFLNHVRHHMASNPISDALRAEAERIKKIAEEQPQEEGGIEGLAETLQDLVWGAIAEAFENVAATITKS